MSDQKVVTEREAVKRERDAFIRGAIWRGTKAVLANRPACDEAKELYPLPKITRPRVVADPHIPDMAWRVVGENVQCRDGHELESGEWMIYGVNHSFRVSVDAKRAKLWADLFANPTEECEDNESDPGVPRVTDRQEHGR